MEEEEDEEVAKPTLRLSGCEGFVWEREDKEREEEESDEEEVAKIEVGRRGYLTTITAGLSLSLRLCPQRSQEDRKKQL